MAVAKTHADETRPKDSLGSAAERIRWFHERTLRSQFVSRRNQLRDKPLINTTRHP